MFQNIHYFIITAKKNSIPVLKIIFIYYLLSFSRTPRLQYQGSQIIDFTSIYITSIFCFKNTITFVLSFIVRGPRCIQQLFLGNILLVLLKSIATQFFQFSLEKFSFLLLLFIIIFKLFNSFLRSEVPWSRGLLGLSDKPIRPDHDQTYQHTHNCKLGKTHMTKYKDQVPTLSNHYLKTVQIN